MDGQDMLDIAGLSVAYGGLRALAEVSLKVEAGQFVTVVGPNGAGKSTLFKAISGIVPAAAGSIRFDGEDLLARAADRRAHLGIAHVPEGRQVFKTLTVRENLEMGAYPEAGRRQWGRTLERIHTLFPILAERREQLAGTLSGGEQQMLAIGRALVLNPRLLLLDEPTEGLAPIIVDEVLRALRGLARDEGLSMIIVEQKAQKILGFTDDAIILDRGSIVHHAASADLLQDQVILDQHLGAVGKTAPAPPHSH
jgi:branched-chain amino acid transport system ATP-binding protein